MNQKAKQSGFFGELRSKLKARLLRSPLREWHWKNLKTILSNVRYRIVFLFLDLGLVILLLYLLSYTVNHIYFTSLANQLFSLGIFVFVLFLPIAYGWRSFNQILFEVSLNTSIFNVRADINRLTKKRNERDIRLLHIDINRVRMCLKDFISVSQILSPPIYNYELDRVQKGIDIFFNSIGELLFPFKGPYSRGQKIDQQLTLKYYESQEHPTDEELAWQFEKAQKHDKGEIDSFDYQTFDEFMEYLGDVVFAKTTPFRPFSYRHSIDFIDISRFFETWNSIVSHCDKGIFEKAKRDIDEYYKLVGQKRQRFSRLTDNVVVVIISVVLSVVLSKVI